MERPSQMPERETLLIDPEEEALRALVDGVGVIHEFIDPHTAEAFGKFLSEQIGKDEDTDGIPLDFESVSAEHDAETLFRLDEENIQKLQAIEKLYIDLMRRAYPEFANTTDPVISGEVLKYITSGMEPHTDNYERSAFSEKTDHQELYVLNGVLTLMGEADYSYLDPDTNKWETIRVKPGTLLISRSGDIQGLPQIKHAVSPPKPNNSGKLTERIVLLLGI